MNTCSPAIWFFRLATLFCLLAAAPAARAVVDDAHTAALSAATSAVKAGFSVRQEYSKGTAKSGVPVMVKQQLFKGNEIWFWLGCAADDVKMEIEVYDAAGKKVSVEKKTASDSISVRVLPAKTGTYRVVFKITGIDAEMDWALVYGWK